jgi:hypothetical protein
MTISACSAKPPLRCHRRLAPLAIGLGAAVPLLLLGTATAFAYPHPMMPGGSVKSGPDTSGMFIQISADPPYECSVTFDNNANATAGGPANAQGILNFNNLPAQSSGYHTAHINCHNKNGDWSLPDQPVPGASGAAAPAPAATAGSQLTGAYFVKSPNGDSATWTFTPCGAGCLHIDSSNGWSGDAHLANGQWNFGGTVPNGWRCPDGTTGPVTMTYSWADGSLSGTSQVTEVVNCIDHAGMVNVAGKQPPTPFTMTKK